MWEPLKHPWSGLPGVVTGSSGEGKALSHLPTSAVILIQVSTAGRGHAAAFEEGVQKLQHCSLIKCR